jgi:hypothetical protein
VAAGALEEDGSDDDGLLTSDDGAGEEGADEEAGDGVEMEQCCADGAAMCCSNSGFVHVFAGE